MGRGRIPMEVIEKEKARKTTFDKRKKGLMKKAYEFSILCGVDVGVIIYAPKFLDEPETYPNSRDIKHVIRKYQNTTGDRRPKVYDVQEYFNDRMKKIDADISKVQKEKIKIMYPTWNDSYNSLGEEQLRILVSILDAKLDACNQKMNLLKGDSKGKGIAEQDKTQTLTSYMASKSTSNLNFMDNMSQTQPFPPSHRNNNNQLAFYPYQVSQSSQSMEKNAMVDWANQVGGGACDPYMGVLKDDATFQTLIDQSPDQPGLPPGLELNGFYASNMFQPQFFNYMHGRN